MSTTALKLVLDTNIIIAIIGRNSPFRWLFDALIEGKIALCISNEIILEYHEMLARKNGKEVADNVILFILLNPLTERVEPYYKFNLIEQDADDNKFVDCAIVADALCLVSNDSHFKILHQIPFPKVNWLTLNEFTNTYKAQLTYEV